VGLTRVAVVELRGKYAEMLVMRIEHETGREDLPRVRTRMGALAARFPGALREIDRLELGEIRRRVASLDAWLDGSGAGEPWMDAVALFHRLARGALGAKRWLGRRRAVDAGMMQDFERELARLPDAEAIREWASDLASIASPPRGRVMDLVFARLARELGTSDEAARRRVFSGG
jgi:hypothetical protein